MCCISVSIDRFIKKWKCQLFITKQVTSSNFNRIDQNISEINWIHILSHLKRGLKGVPAAIKYLFMSQYLDFYISLSDTNRSSLSFFPSTSNSRQNLQNYIARHANNDPRKIKKSSTSLQCISSI